METRSRVILTKWVPGVATVVAESDQRLVLEDSIALQRDPVSAE